MFEDMTMAVHSSCRGGDPAGQDKLLELLLRNGATVESLKETAQLDVVLIDIGRTINLRLPPHVVVLDYVWAELSARGRKLVGTNTFQPIFWGGSGKFFSRNEFIFVMPDVPHYRTMVRKLKCAGARICFEAATADVILVDIELDWSGFTSKPTSYVVDYTWAELCLRSGCYFSVTPFLVNCERPPARPRIAAPQRLALRALAEAEEEEDDDDEYDDQDDFDVLENEMWDLGSQFTRTSRSFGPSSRPASQVPEMKLEQGPGVHQTAISLRKKELHPPPIPPESACANRPKDNEAVNQFIERLLEWEWVRQPSIGIYSICGKVDRMKIFAPRTRVFSSYWRRRQDLLKKIKQEAKELRQNGYKAVGKFGDDIGRSSSSSPSKKNSRAGRRKTR